MMTACTGTSEMNESGCIREFEKLAKRMGIELRYNAEGPSGLCTVRGKQVLFIDRSMGVRLTLDMYISEFRTVDLTGYFVVPVIRELLGKDQNGNGW